MDLAPRVGGTGGGQQFIFPRGRENLVESVPRRVIVNIEPSVDVLGKFSNVRLLTENLAVIHPNGAPWPTLLALLRSYEEIVRDHWPLTNEEKAACTLGWFSVRNIEDVFPQLHAAISDIAYSFRHSGD